MVTEETLAKFGLVKDENNLQLKKIFMNGTKLKEVHIDVYPENPLVVISSPFMLLLRVVEKSVIVENNDERIILKRNDECFTHFMNITFSSITECFFKASESFTEFILNVRNIYYRLIILN